ncbi:MAG: hypothetical protein U1F43_19005 [Myxococcota bacterium]
MAALGAVTDAMGNPVGGVPVQFQVTAGFGSFADGQTTVVDSNAKGIAEVTFAPGKPEEPGTPGRRDRDHPQTRWAPTPTRAAAWCSAAAPGTRSSPACHRHDQRPPAPGVIVDENQVPIPNVRVTSTPPSSRAELTGPDGRFTLDGVPEGFVLLTLDGADAVPDLASYHLTHMTFMANVVSGIANQLDRPVYFLNLPGGTFVDGKQEVTLANDLLTGLSLTIHPGTVTFADGSHEGYVSVTPVSFDQAPMAPIDGLQPRLLVTIQPPNVKFDPPATFRIPNSEGYAPGEKVTMFSYDHTIDEFVTIGTGSVSPDGTTIESDPGVGVREGGWHSAANPNPPGKAGNITATLDIVPTSMFAARAVAGGSPSADTDWEYCLSGDISFFGPTTCHDTPTCNVSVIPKGGNISSAGKVKVVHRSRTTGQSAQDTKDVAFCDQAPMKSKYSGTFTPKFIDDYMKKISDTFKPFGCDFSPALNISAEYESYEACCTGCPGVTSRSGSMALGANASLEIACAIPGASFPPVKFGSYGTFEAGLFGVIRGGLSLKANFGFDTCYDPTRITETGSAELGFEAALQLRGVVKFATINVISIIGEAVTGIKGSLTLSNDSTCDPQAKLDAQLCWTGFALKYTITSDALSQGYEGEYVLFQPIELAHGQRCVDVPPPPAGVPGNGKCPKTPPPIPDPSCGVPTPPSGGPTGGGNGQSQGSSSYAGSCPSTPTGQRFCTKDSDCQDSDVCNGAETCGSDGFCKPGASLLCAEDPGLECVVTKCDSIKGCVHIPHPEKCNDSVDCTINQCIVGQGCVYNPDSTRCNDHIDCTTDYCDRVADCQHDPLDIVCNDNQTCTTDHCNAASGCEYQSDDQQCQDTVNCSNDTCEPFKGCQHKPDDTKCDDQINCTDDKCDIATDCKHTPQDSKCDDHIDCTNDSCDDSLGCKNEPDKTQCDDGVGCTNDECTPTGCKSTADSSLCNDHTTCTDDSCDPVLDCQFEPNDGKCDDSRSCTTDACVPGAGPSGCVNTVDSCDDNDPCTADSCGATCEHAPISGCGSNGGGTGASCSTSASCPGQGAPVCDGTQVTISQCDAGHCNTQVVGCGGLPPYCRNDVLYRINCGSSTCDE